MKIINVLNDITSQKNNEEVNVSGIDSDKEESEIYDQVEESIIPDDNKEKMGEASSEEVRADEIGVSTPA